jgi:NAD(P)-dependent dehydrogenase (short-subunit alcohol dehydrogenase family)
MPSEEDFNPVSGSYGSFTKIYHDKPYDTISPLRPELSSKGKNVIVTGGGTGIGKAIAIAFAQSKAASVSIVGRREDRLISASKEISGAATGHTRVLYRVTDLTDSSSTEASFKSIAAEVGKIHVLISNAGVLGEIGYVAKVNVDNLMRAFDLNVRSAFNAVQAFVPVAGNEPVIVSISTAAIHIAPISQAIAYTASKLANYKAFEYLAAENPELHIVQIQPGVVATEINMGMVDVDRDRRKYLSERPTLGMEKC